MKNGYLIHLRILALGLLAVVLLASLISCSDSEEEATTTPTGTIKETPSPTVVQKEITLRVGSTKPYKTANVVGDDWYNVLASLTTHDSLIRLDENVQPSPWLAESWDISPDSTIFTFNITDGAKWHDGTPLTVEDVRFSIEYYRDNVAYAGWMQDIIDNVEVDGRRVIVNLKKPYGNFLVEMMSYDMIPKHIWEDVDDPMTYNGSDVSVGSGPFILEKWDQTAGKFKFRANEDYFQGKPNIDRLEVDVYSNMDVLVMALAQGEIDTWWDYSGEFPYTHMSLLEKSDDIEFASATFLGIPAAMAFNMDRYPTSELAFRQAITQAINYEQIVSLVFQGYGTVPTYAFVPSTHPNFNTSVPTMEYNPDEAASLLASMGLRDDNGNGILEDSNGDDIVLTFLVRGDKDSIVRTAELVKSYIEDIGLGVEFKSVEFSTWYEIKESLDYDLAFFRCTPWGMMMHAGHGSGYFDSRRTGQGVLHNMDEQEYLDTCDLRLATAIASEQKELDYRIQELHYEYLPGIALAWIDSIYPYQDNWDGWVIDQVYGGVVNCFSWFTATKSSE